jgi:hypothetical protein
MGDDNKIHHKYERVVVSGEGATAREIRIFLRVLRVAAAGCLAPSLRPRTLRPAQRRRAVLQ